MNSAKLALIFYVHDREGGGAGTAERFVDFPHSY